jgi:hypothetical protein
VGWDISSPALIGQARTKYGEPLLSLALAPKGVPWGFAAFTFQLHLSVKDE